MRKALRKLDLRGYRVDDDRLAGRPDVVFSVARVVVFCDGDFWHGRDLEARIGRLSGGHNAPYWVGKISGNVARDRKRNEELAAAGWTVLRFWESDILKNADEIASRIRDVVLTSRIKVAGNQRQAKRLR